MNIYTVIAYVVTDVMLVISLSDLIVITFITIFMLDTESKTPYPLTSSAHLPASLSSSLSGSIVTPTPTVTQGK